jgi:hypothetical protein
MARPGLRQHPKFKRLLHLLREPVPHVLGYLECLWEVGYQAGNPVIGDPTDIELAAEYPGETGKLFKALLDCRLIDEVGDQYQIHDLMQNAPEYVQRRMEREASRKQSGKTVSDVRRDAARARWDKQTHANDERLYANGATPSPAQVQGREESLKPSCPEPAEPATGPTTPAASLLTYPTVGKKDEPRQWFLTADLLASLREAFPTLDALGECRRALEWVLADTGRRKTSRGMRRFLFGWLSRSQNRGLGRTAAPPPRPKDYTAQQQAAAWVRQDDDATRMTPAECEAWRAKAAREGHLKGTSPGGP